MLWQSDPFGGAACVSYSFASNASSVTVGIADADQYLDNNYRSNPVRFSYTICGATNCTSSSTYALNASAGHYLFNISNPSNDSANVVLTYTLYPASSSGEPQAGLSAASFGIWPAESWLFPRGSDGSCRWQPDVTRSTKVVFLRYHQWMPMYMSISANRCMCIACILHTCIL